jgi:amino acid adenylation domain-containing protein/non-ribosomal peptide synthase protein (TIGR01720 family)
MSGGQMLSRISLRATTQCQELSRVGHEYAIPLWSLSVLAWGSLLARYYGQYTVSLGTCVGDGALKLVLDAAVSPVNHARAVQASAPTPFEASPGFPRAALRWGGGGAPNWLCADASGELEFDLILAFEGGVASLSLYYSKALTAPFAERLGQDFLHYLGRICSAPEARLDSLEFLVPGERQALFRALNPEHSRRAGPDTLVELFESQARARPDLIALEYEGQAMTYRQLDEQSDAFAACLRASYAEAGGAALERDTLIGLFLERGPQRILAILAILKAGAAYVPLEPTYPDERVRFIVEDSETQLVLCDKALKDRLISIRGAQRAPAILAMDDHATNDRTSLRAPVPARAVAGGDLAYVIYTSGSTGKPKGVLSEHVGAARLAQDIIVKLGLGPGVRMLQFSSMAFDASLFEWVGTLGSGATLVLAAARELPPEADLAEVLVRRQIHVAMLPPSVIRSLQRRQLPELRTLISAGEPCTPDIVRDFAAGRSLLNGYGPTEASSVSTLAVLRTGQAPHLGTAVWGKTIHVLTPWLEPVPRGVIGELCIGGEGVGRGYLKRPELSADRFVKLPARLCQPNTPCDRLYRTGDLVRVAEGGALEYIGRNDNQVKVRGYRIELGEIECRLCEHPLLHEAVVVYEKDEQGRGLLVACCVTASPETDESVLRAELSSSLAGSLPSYMIPQRFDKLDNLPLTANGKIDRALLGARAFRKRTQVLAPPSSECERVLCEVWQEVLGVPSLGVDQNFYALGGDSILAISVLHKAELRGLLLRTSDLIGSPDIRNLATKVKRARCTPEAETPPANVPFDLSPIQHWFFERSGGTVCAFGQYQVVRLASVDPPRLECALHALVHRHDAFRLGFPRTAAGRRQMYRESPALPQLTRVSLKGASAALVEQECEGLYRRWLGELDPEHGKSVATALVYGHPDGKIRLFIALHHLIVDGVSWRILLEELRRTYFGETPAESASSHFAFTRALADYAVLPSTERHLEYWVQAQRSAAQFRLPTELRTHTRSPSAHSGRAQLLTEQPLHTILPGSTTPQSPARRQRAEILIAAFAQALAQWCHCRRVAFQLEGHGREECAGVAPGASVGWYTSLFPLSLELPESNSAWEVFCAVREQYRRLPHQGRSYGALRYLHPNPEIRRSLSGPACAVLFNYLGSFQEPSSESGDGWQLYDTHSAQDFGGEALTGLPAFELNCSVLGERLVCSTRYEEELLSRDQVETFLGCFWSCARNLTASVNAQEAPAADACTSPSFPLTALQEGLLFHAQNRSDDTYLVQCVWRYDSVPERARMERAFRALCAELEPFRSRIVWDAERRPRQAIAEHASIETAWTDLSALSTVEQERSYAEILSRDRSRPFDLGQPGCFRAHWLERSNACCDLLLTYHHIFLDGWSLPLVLQRLHEHYEQGGEAERSTLPRPQFEDFVRYTRARPIGAARAYFSAQFAEPAAGELTIGRVSDSDPLKPVVEQGETRSSIEGGEATALSVLARAEGVTVGALLLFAFGVTLSAHSHSKDVVFATTLSGRGHDLPGLDVLIGITINTLPVVFRPNHSATVSANLHQMHETLGWLNEHSAYPLREIVDSHGAPVRFSSLIVFENYPRQDRVATPGLSARLLAEHEKTAYPLTVVCRYADSALELKYLYDREVMSSESVAALGEQIRSVLLQVCAAPHQPYSELKLPPAAPRPDLQRCAPTLTAPSSHAASVLRSAWLRVLGVREVGPTNTFYGLGGDSLNAIQVAAAVGKEGYSLSGADLLRFPTFEACARCMRPLIPAPTRPRSVASAPQRFPLSPAQRRFFQRNLPNPQHFVIPLFLRLRQPLEQSNLRDALARALRGGDSHEVYFESDARGEMYQVRRAWSESDYFEQVELSTVDAQQHRARVQHQASSLCRALEIDRGPLFRAVQFDGFEGSRTPLLYLLFHHLIFDGWSLRLLLERLRAACLSPAGEAQVPASYLDWSVRVAEYVERHDFQEQRRYWQTVSRGTPLRHVRAPRPRHEDMAAVELPALRGADLGSRLSGLAAGLGVSAFVVLLAQFFRALHATGLLTSPTIDIQSSLRDDHLASGLGSCAEIPGYFSGALPLRAPPSDEPLELIRLIRKVDQQVQEVRRHGLDYLLLRYVLPEPGSLPGFSDVLFHYMNGDPRHSASDFFCTVDLDSGPPSDPRNPSNYLLNATLTSSSSQLVLRLYYSRAHYTRGAIDNLAREFRRGLEASVRA